MDNEHYHTNSDRLPLTKPEDVLTCLPIQKAFQFSSDVSHNAIPSLISSKLRKEFIYPVF